MFHFPLQAKCLEFVISSFSNIFPLFDMFFMEQDVEAKRNNGKMWFDLGEEVNKLSSGYKSVNLFYTLQKENVVAF